MSLDAIQGTDALDHLKSKPRSVYSVASSSIQAYRYHGGADPLDLWIKTPTLKGLRGT